MSTFTRFLNTATRTFGLLFAISILLGAAALFAQTPNNHTATHPTPVTMKTFVLIFRQNPARERTPAQNQQLATEMPPWVQRQSSEQRKFDPRILAKESARVGAEKGEGTPPGSWPISALLFVEASDLADATRVAESHPALKFGTSVEVRPWAAPVPPAPLPTGAATP